MSDKNEYGSYAKVSEDLSYKIIKGRCLKCGNEFEIKCELLY